ncbi:MAG: hypothetical protein U1F25_00670 [Rubrivivax sp.]
MRSSIQATRAYELQAEVSANVYGYDFGLVSLVSRSGAVAIG